MADAFQLPVGLPWPVNVGGLTFSSFSLNGATDQLEFVFQMREAATLTEGWVRLNAVTGVSPTYTLELQGVDASGNPDGTALAATVAFTPSGAGTIQKQAFISSYAATRGQLLALVMKHSVGLIDATNFASMTTGQATAAVDFPYQISNDAGVRARNTTIPVFGVASASKAYGLPALGAVQQTINSAGPAEAGAKFALPAGWGATYQVAGVRFYGGTLTAAKALAVKLYQGGAAGDVTVLQSKTWDSDFNATVSVANSSVVMFDGLATLNFGDTYRVAVSTTDASNQNFQGFSVAAAADMEAFPLGQQFTLTTRTAGNWTDTATSRLFMELILADITAPAGATVIARTSNLWLPEGWN